MDRGVRYAQVDGDRSVAYDVLGEGDVDLLLVPAMVSHVELMWGDPAVARFLRRLGSFVRLIVYDKLGTGLSDPITTAPSVEDRAREALAVLDAVGVERVAVMGLFDGGATAAFLAVAEPARIESLVLHGTHPVGARVEDAPDWEDGEWVERFDEIESLAAGWGDGRTLAFFSGTETNVVERQFWSTFERASASPGMVRVMVRELGQRDLRALLGQVTQPVLVLHPAADRIHPLEQARLVADLLQDSRLVAVQGESRWPWAADPTAVLAELADHLTGDRTVPGPAATSMAVVFTDVVRSTELAASLGDERWRERVEALDTLTRRVVAAHGGRHVKGTGDGALAVFAGPVQAVRCARGVLGAAPDLELELRAGVHWGSVESLHDGDIAGLVVHTAARVCGRAAPGEVLVTRTVRSLAAGSNLLFIDRGVTELAGLPAPLHLFATVSDDGSRDLGEPAADLGEPAADLGGPAADLGGPAASRLRLRDRVAVAITRRTPAVARLLSRVTSPRGTSGSPPEVR